MREPNFDDDINFLSDATSADEMIEDGRNKKCAAVLTGELAIASLLVGSIYGLINTPSEHKGEKAALAVFIALLILAMVGVGWFILDMMKPALTQCRAGLFPALLSNQSSHEAYQTIADSSRQQP